MESTDDAVTHTFRLSRVSRALPHICRARGPITGGSGDVSGSRQKFALWIAKLLFTVSRSVPAKWSAFSSGFRWMISGFKSGGNFECRPICWQSGKRSLYVSEVYAYVYLQGVSNATLSLNVSVNINLRNSRASSTLFLDFLHFPLLFLKVIYTKHFLKKNLIFVRVFCLHLTRG